MLKYAHTTARRSSYRGVNKMLLSTASTVWFYIACIALGACIVPILNGIFNTKMDGDDRFLCGLVGFMICVIPGLSVAAIVSGGMKAHDINDGLTNDGFTVVSIDTDRNQATVVHGDKLVTVQVYESGYPQVYHAYQACRVDTNLVTNPTDCAAVPK